MNKYGPLFLISALIFLLASSPSLSSSILTTGDDLDLVLDVWGNPLIKDVEYIISLPFVPTYDQLGGSVKLFTANEKCEAYVTVAPFDIYNGTGFTFTPVNGRDDFIRLGNPLSIQSPSSENPCGDTTVWQVGPPIWFYDNITTGGIINTGPSCLRITKPSHQIVSNSHIIEHCSYMCGGANSCHALSYFLSATSGALLIHLTTSFDSPILQFVFIPIRCPPRSP